MKCREPYYFKLKYINTHKNTISPSHSHTKTDTPKTIEKEQLQEKTDRKFTILSFLCKSRIVRKSNSIQKKKMAEEIKYTRKSTRNSLSYFAIRK